MRVIKASRVREYAKANPVAEKPLMTWLKEAEAAEWTSLQDVRSVFPNADGMEAASGRTVTVFNIGGNKFRLITAIHYNRQIVYILRFMTHAEYDMGNQKWRRHL